MASSQMKFYGLLGAIAAVGIALIGYVATRPDPGATPVTIDSTARPLAIGDLVPLEAGIVRGNADAPVTIEEYADLLCPYCSMFAQLTAPQIMERYVDTGKVRYVFFDFPIHQGEASFLGAEAGRCAAEQGAFWQMHNILFGRVREWSTKRNPRATFRQYAESLGLDGGSFKECVDSGKYREAVLATRRRGEQMGVDRTPTFIINGNRRETGALAFDRMAAIIEEELAKIEMQASE